jgi:hypothetical protein
VPIEPKVVAKLENESWSSLLVPDNNRAKPRSPLKPPLAGGAPRSRLPISRAREPPCITPWIDSEVVTISQGI